MEPTLTVICATHGSAACVTCNVFLVRRTLAPKPGHIRALRERALRTLSLLGY